MFDPEAPVAARPVQRREIRTDHDNGNIIAAGDTEVFVAQGIARVYLPDVHEIGHTVTIYSRSSAHIEVMSITGNRITFLPRHDRRTFRLVGTDPRPDWITVGL